jgi:transcription antitermination factor NusG
LPGGAGTLPEPDAESPKRSVRQWPRQRCARKFWDVIERITDVVNVVRTYSGDLSMLRQSDIDTIRDIERGLNTPKLGKSLHHFKTGDKVRFTDDLLNRWPPGRVAGSINDGRISVEVEVMGRVVPFQVYPHQIEGA